MLLPRLRLTLRLRETRRPLSPEHTPRLLAGMGLALAAVALSSSCVVHRSLIEDVWKEAVRRSGYPREGIRRPEIVEPPAALRNSPLPRDDNNQPVVAQYFPLSHQVRIYAKAALPIRRILLREFLYAIYYDQLTSRPLDVESLAGLEPARQWVEQALARELDSTP
jgi:hypothetical protein